MYHHALRVRLGIALAAVIGAVLAGCMRQQQ